MNSLSENNTLKQKLLTIDVLSYPVFSSSLESLSLAGKKLVNTINQYSYVLAERDVVFKNALKQSDVLLPDGVGITSACLLLTGKKIKKIAGADLHAHLLNELQKVNGTCFYLGSSAATLEKIRNRLAFEYPGIKAGFYAPSFSPAFSKSENQQMLAAINKFKPDVLFIGLTAPKQEKWAFENKNEIDASLICSIGAVFDFYAGTVRRPSKIFIALGLEWLGRLIKEPRRVGKRYLYFGPVFILLLLKKKWEQVLLRSF